MSDFTSQSPATRLSSTKKLVNSIERSLAAGQRVLASILSLHIPSLGQVDISSLKELIRKRKQIGFIWDVKCTAIY
jgi:hypothetical protein